MSLDLQDARKGAGDDMVLTFVLDGEVFGVEVGVVSEIIDPLPITRVPNADPFAPALINVRGTIVPLVDLRRRLGMRPVEIGATSRILVLTLIVEEEPTFVALLADDVDSIVEAPPSQIEPVPELGIRWPAELIRGVARQNGNLLILLNGGTVFPPRAGTSPLPDSKGGSPCA